MTFVRPVHGPAEELAEEMVALDDLSEQVYDGYGSGTQEDTNHLPITVQFWAAKMFRMQGEQMIRMLAGGDIEATTLLPELHLAIAFRIGYEAALAGMDFEPCWCHMSREQRQHYDNTIKEYLQKNHPDRSPDA